MTRFFPPRRMVSCVGVALLASLIHVTVANAGTDFLSMRAPTIGVPGEAGGSVIAPRSHASLSSLPNLDTHCASVPCDDVLRDAAANTAAPVRQRRPVALVPLYIAFGGMQILEVHSTLSSIDRGARETNSFVAGFTSSPTSMIVLKTASSAAIVYLTEKLWKRNRMAAVLTMVGLNVGYGAVVVHNYSVVQ